MPHLSVYTLGELGVNRVKSPLQVKDGELLQSQNATVKTVKNQLALAKRDGLAKINSSVAAGSILSIANMPFANPGSIAYADDWTLRTATSVGWRSVAWSPTLGLLAAVKANDVMTSTDGINWTDRTAASGSTWNDVAWSPTLGLFAAVHSDNTALTNQVMTSTDGVSWTLRTTPGGTNGLIAVKAITWAQSLGLFAAVGVSNPGKPQVMTSPDGVNWTLRTTPDVDLKEIAWSEDLGLFVAINGAGSSHADAPYFVTSPDGINWTQRDTGNSCTWQDITWNPTNSLFVAVGSANLSGSSRLITSPDGITWTQRTPPTEGTWITVNGESNLIVSLAETTTSGNNGMKSTDGVTWTEFSIPTTTNNSWSNLIWIDELSLFVTVRFNTVSLNLNVMTSR